MLTSSVLRSPAELRGRPTVTFTDAFGDTTTGIFLGVEPDGQQSVRILDGGRIYKRATKTRTGTDRAFDLVIA